MKTLHLKYFIIFVIFIMNCNHATEPLPTGAFRYTSYDSTGTALVSGWFALSFSDTSNISGEWHFKPIGTPKNIGPQTGDGHLVGGMNNHHIWIELNPQFKDNNLELRGTLSGGQFFGQWTWLSFIGITNAGTFKAVKK